MMYMLYVYIYMYICICICMYDMTLNTLTYKKSGKSLQTTANKR